MSSTPAVPSPSCATSFSSASRRWRIRTPFSIGSTDVRRAGLDRALNDQIDQVDNRGSLAALLKSRDRFTRLLPETNPRHALTLGERTRTMIEERLTFRDYRTEQRAVVTVSVGVASARALEGAPIDHEEFSAHAVAALSRAKTGGGNRVEQVELLPRLISIEQATQLLNIDIQGIEKLVADGALDPVNSGRHVRLERKAVEALTNE